MLVTPADASGPSIATILLLALLVDAVFGDMQPMFRWLPHPVALLGRLIAGLDRRLNREDRGRRARGLRGLVMTLVLAGLVGWLSWRLSGWLRAIPVGSVIELFLVALLLAQRSLFDHVCAVAMALPQGVTQGRDAVRHIVGRDSERLDKHGVARAAIESLAENFSDGVVAPVVWYLLLGLPGLMVYKTVNTLDSMIGHRNERYEAFGKAAALLDDLLNLVPARASAILIALAATFAPGGRPARALMVAVRDAAKHASPNAGWPEAAMAGAIGIALLGPRTYGDVVVDYPWLGEQFPARARAADVHRALFVYTAACLMLFGLVALLAARGLFG